MTILALHAPLKLSCSLARSPPTSTTDASFCFLCFVFRHDVVLRWFSSGFEMLEQKKGLHGVPEPSFFSEVH